MLDRDRSDGVVCEHPLRRFHTRDFSDLDRSREALLLFFVPVKDHAIDFDPDRRHGRRAFSLGLRELSRL